VHRSDVGGRRCVFKITPQLLGLANPVLLVAKNTLQNKVPPREPVERVQPLCLACAAFRGGKNGLLAGKSAQVIGNPDMPHTYHYIPDVAAALAVLGTGPENTLGRVWMLPCAPAVTTREFIARMGAALGRDLQVKRFPCWLFRVLKPVVPVFRELDEMLYQWDEPFVVDDRHFRETFGITATPLDEALSTTVAWARAAFITGSSR